MVFLSMKTPSSCSPHSTVLAHLAKHPWGLRAPSLALLAALILAPDEREDVRLTKLAAQLPGKALQSSKVKQLHRFFKNIRISEDVLARLELHLCCVAQAKRGASGLRGIELQIRPG